MFDLLLKAKQEYETESKQNANGSDFEKFSQDFAEFQKGWKEMTPKPTKEQLYGRPYKS